MHIAICDDEEFFRKSLIEQLNKYSIEKGLDFLYYEYNDGVDLLASKIDFDIIFMDFQMKDKNGIDTVSALRQRNNNTHVIFASSYKDVATAITGILFVTSEIVPCLSSPAAYDSEWI